MDSDEGKGKAFHAHHESGYCGFLTIVEEDAVLSFKYLFTFIFQFSPQRCYRGYRLSSDRQVRHATAAPAAFIEISIEGTLLPTTRILSVIGVFGCKYWDF
jgi:hypothetical protein